MKLKKTNPWILSVVAHLGVVLFIALLIWGRSREPLSFVVSLEPISSRKTVAVKATPSKPELEGDAGKLASQPEVAATASSSKLSFGIQTIKDQYLYELKQYLQSHLVYPAASMSMREKGRVEIIFSIDRSGKIDGVAINKPCEYSRLNQAALDLVESVSRFKAFPPQMTETELRLAIPIDYEI